MCLWMENIEVYARLLFFSVYFRLNLMFQFFVGYFFSVYGGRVTPIAPF